jgi:hypothetical protein
MRWEWHVAGVGDTRNIYKIMVGKPEGKSSLGRTRRRWRDNTKIDLREIGWKVVDWIHVAQDMDQWRVVVNTVMNPWIPLKAGISFTC